MARTITAGSPERQNRLIFIGAIVLAALAAVLIFLALSDVGGDDGGPASFAGSVNVVVASGEIEAGSRITGDMLSIATLPENGIVEGALTDEAGLEGLVARQNMAKGEQFTAAKVGMNLADEDRTLSAIVPPGLRAVAVEVDESRFVGGLIVAGDRVDVVLVRDSVVVEDGAEIPQANTLLQDIEVLAVAQETQRPVARLDKDGNPINTDTADGELSVRPEDASANEDADTVTLAVPPEDAALLALAQENGNVWLVLRGQGDSEIVPLGPVGLE